jgi:L-threonylcarbamoyladenylate synthase
MKPRVFTIDPLNIDLDLIRQAAEVIHNRGLVAFPTETVYGLGANALDPKAVAGIFEAKKRPLDDPLIVHIFDRSEIRSLARDIPLEAERLMEKFWPGPLTVVLRKTGIVPDLVTTGLDTVAIRMPAHPVARKLIEIAASPIAAPSANLFGRPSPTSAAHVIEDLKGRIDIVLDAGCAEIGVESTVVEFVDGKAIILRPGGTEAEEIKKVVGQVKVHSAHEEVENSPGKYPQHYSPSAEVRVVENGPSQKQDVAALAEDLNRKGQKIGIMARQEHAGYYKHLDVKVLGPGDDPRICASRLFNMLREFDREKVDVIIAEGLEEKGLGLAVMNRLRKASG